MLIVGERCTVNVLSNPMYNIRMVDDNTVIKSHRCIIEVDTHTIYSPHYSHIAYTDHLNQTFQKTFFESDIWSLNLTCCFICIISRMISRSTVDCKTPKLQNADVMPLGRCKVYELYVAWTTKDIHVLNVSQTPSWVFRVIGLISVSMLLKSIKTLVYSWSNRQLLKCMTWQTETENNVFVI